MRKPEPNPQFQMVCRLPASPMDQPPYSVTKRPPQQRRHHTVPLGSSWLQVRANHRLRKSGQGGGDHLARCQNTTRDESVTAPAATASWCSAASPPSWRPTCFSVSCSSGASSLPMYLLGRGYSLLSPRETGRGNKVIPSIRLALWHTKLLICIAAAPLEASSTLLPTLRTMARCLRLCLLRPALGVHHRPSFIPSPNPTPPGSCSSEP
ncbi:hypothetical protein LX36DRAFT_136188 [Colletotrichum falcatum]|nr:hypothetical protein LX36DRAFT_136188 [Colletotrichum falcatum]